MIIVEIKRNQQQDIHSFSMSGHAEFDAYGKDIVCAGASAVSFGAVNAIAELLQVELTVEMEEGGGFLRCTVPQGLDVQVYEKVQLLLEGMLVSLRSIEAEYGKYMQVRESN